MDNQSDEVKHFLLSLDINPEGSILELDGKELLHVAPMESIPLAPEDVTSVQRGIEEMEAGRGRPFEEVDADIRKSLNTQT